MRSLDYALFDGVNAEFESAWFLAVMLARCRDQDWLAKGYV